MEKISAGNAFVHGEAKGQIIGQVGFLIACLQLSRFGKHPVCAFIQIFKIDILRKAFLEFRHIGNIAKGKQLSVDRSTADHEKVLLRMGFGVDK